jgi:hypothetical protein
MENQNQMMTKMNVTLIELWLMEDGDDELVGSVNQHMTPLAPEFEVVSVDDQYECNDWADSRRHSGLLVNELEVGKIFRDTFECVNAVKR